MTKRKTYLKKAKKMASICQIFMGVKAIYLSGSLATETDNDKSDIDFFIITHHGQIFTARFFVNLFLKIFGQLAKPNNHTGKICPNHFISDKNLTLKEQNKYTNNMFSQNIPLSDPLNTWPEFQQENPWIKDWKHVAHKSKQTYKKINWIETKIEHILKNIQIWKTQKNKKFSTSAKIVLTNEELRFHPVLKSTNNL